MTLHAMHGQFCSHCGEGIWDEESYRRYREAQEGLVRAVKGDPGADIRRIRKKLNITQAKLALAFGVGKVAFSRYERGETRPSGTAGQVVETHRPASGFTRRDAKNVRFDDLAETAWRDCR